MDQEALQDAPIVNVLCQSGLLNFFGTSPMRANVHLLDFLINYWDHDLGMFDLQGEILEIHWRMSTSFPVYHDGELR